MAGEDIVKVGTQKTLEANGASITTTSVVQADDATYAVVADGGGYPDGEFALSCAYGSAPTEGTLISLYARVLDIDGTNDTDVPEATRPGYVVGAFVVNNVTSTQYLWCYAQDLPLVASYYLHNNGTGQTISAGWTLKVTPRSRGPA